MKDIGYLIEYAQQQVGKPYWGGTYGQIATEALLNSKRNQYPSLYPDPGNPPFKSQLGQKVHDCNGLMYAASVCDTPDSAPIKYPQPYYGVPTLYKHCEDAGTIKSDTELAYGEFVFRNNKGHVGVYANGYVYHAKGHKWGVVKEKYIYSQWTHHGKFKEMYKYRDDIRKVTVTVNLPFLKTGSVNEGVVIWQEILSFKGYDIGSCGIDGDFGTDTLKATKDFQRDEKIQVDGQVGKDTWTHGLNSIS